jgi:hypothetical protein
MEGRLIRASLDIRIKRGLLAGANADVGEFENHEASTLKLNIDSMATESTARLSLYLS